MDNAYTKSFVASLATSLQAAAPALQPFAATLSVPGATASAATAVSDVSSFGTQAGIEQSYAVANQIVSFTPSTSEAYREAALLSTLIASAEAKKHIANVTSPSEAEAWQSIYANTFGGIGWIPQGQVSDIRTTSSQGAELNKAIIEIIADVTGAGAVLDTVKGVLSGLAKMNQDDPFITVYERQVFQSHTILLGVTVVTEKDQSFLLQTYDFSMDVEAADTSILVFKWKTAGATVRYRRNDFSLSEPLFASAKTTLLSIANRFVADNVARLSIAAGQ